MRYPKRRGICSIASSQPVLWICYASQKRPQAPFSKILRLSRIGNRGLLYTIAKTGFVRVGSILVVTMVDCVSIRPHPPLSSHSICFLLDKEPDLA